MEKPVTSLERLWAYLTVKQLLDERDSAENSEELTRKAIHLALAYSFVTDVTSLVVVKPNEVLSAVTFGKCLIITSYNTLKIVSKVSNLSYLYL